MARISVALPVHNAEASIRATLDSLVAQTCHDFDVIIFDDASKDDTVQIVAEYETRLDLKLIRSAENLGISGARNRLLAAIEAPYVAILDHDDVCSPFRLEKQLEFLEAHPGIDICGSAIAYFSENIPEGNANHVLRHPADDAAIKTRLLYNTAMVHPSAMARRSFFDDVGPYDERFSPAEDYAMWCRAALLGKRFANLEETLLYYRLHPKQTSKVQAERMVAKDIEIKRFYIKGLLQGAADASLAEFLCPYLRHDKQTLAAVLPGIFPVIFALYDRVPCQKTYGELIGGLLAGYIA